MPRIRLTGTMMSPPGRVEAIRAALPEHIRLTREETGCLEFEVTETQVGTFTVDELFSDRAAFEAHQARAAASTWADVTRDCPRDYTITEE